MNNWDQLSSKFDSHKDEIDPDAADNILIAWPPIIEFITRYFKGSLQGLTALDYGCGTGGFTQKIHSLGLNVVGADKSEGMLKIARESSEDNIQFIQSDQNPSDARYDLITGIMVFQFIENIEEIFGELVEHLNAGGLIVFAVFNPKFVSLCLESQVAFCGFDSTKQPKVGMTDFGDVHIPTYIRTANEYDEMMNKLGLKKELETYPPFTTEFLDKYPIDIPTQEPEYLILGYSH